MNFDIPQVYRQTVDGARYLLSDRIQRGNGTPVTRILVFATDEQLRMLFTSSHILMDGTFDSCPPHFDQIYSIHATKNDHSKLLFLSLDFSEIKFFHQVSYVSLLFCVVDPLRSTKSSFRFSLITLVDSS